MIGLEYRGEIEEGSSRSASRGNESERSIPAARRCCIPL